MTQSSAPIVDYDADAYDYRAFWSDRSYEHWAEGVILGRILEDLVEPGWFADLGGNFGRNVPIYRDRVRHAVLIDYSATALARAARLHAADVAAGRLHLVRADLYRLPFIDAAFDAAMVVRVLHHLSSLDSALGEMSRTVSDAWIVDVPIKHHALGVARAALRGDLRQIRGPEPLVHGSSAFPFSNFQLAAVRERLSSLGWETRLIASVNNLRRWDRVVPDRAHRVVRPIVETLERAAWRVGRGWWGPSQVLLATRPGLPVGAALSDPGSLEGSAAELVRRMRCPLCGGGLTVVDGGAGGLLCSTDARTYPRIDGYWDMAPG